MGGDVVDPENFRPALHGQHGGNQRSGDAFSRLPNTGHGPDERLRLAPTNQRRPPVFSSEKWL